MIPVQSPCGGERWCDDARRQGLLWTLCALDGHLGVLLILGHQLRIRCQTCRYVAVILPAVMAKLAGLDCALNKLARRYFRSRGFDLRTSSKLMIAEAIGLRRAGCLKGFRPIMAMPIRATAPPPSMSHSSTSS